MCFLQYSLGAGVATGYGLEDRGVGVRVPVVSNIFFSLRRQDRLCGLPYLIYNGYGAIFPWDKAAGVGS
jgi:hypothetical protein